MEEPKVNQDFGDTVPSKPINAGLSSINEMSKVAGSVKHPALDVELSEEGAYPNFYFDL